MSSRKQILVSGANDGIGLGEYQTRFPLANDRWKVLFHLLTVVFYLYFCTALSKQLAKDYGAKVFLGSRDATKGAKAVEIVKAHIANDPNGGDVELVVLDVNSPESIAAAVQKLRDEGVKLYGLVNNAGIGLSTDGDESFIINTNYYGTKRVTEAFLPLLEDDARIVMTGSGAGPMTVRNMPPELQKKFAFPNQEILSELEAKMEAGELRSFDSMGGYGTSKAMMHMYASALAKEHPKYRCYSLSPGYIATKLTAKWDGGLPVEEGTVSLRHCLFEAKKEESGWYFGSDGKRSPIHVTRDPGTPVFDGVYPF